jgi:hypothetical protein
MRHDKHKLGLLLAVVISAAFVAGGAATTERK